jgi:hypothetical protein
VSGLSPVASVWVFERFTERARQVVVLAQDEARALRHNYIGTEHILLGLLREEEGVAARVLESLDIRLQELRAQVALIVDPGNEMPTGQIPFTPHAKTVLDLALREAVSLGHSYIGTEHILLGLVREDEGVAARLLLDFDADAEKIRNAVIRMLDLQTADEGLPPGAEPSVDLRLRRVVPVARRLTDGVWLVGVEIWDHGLVIRWRTPQRPPRPPLAHPENLTWLVSDDVGTSYTHWGGGGGGNPQRGFDYDAEFDPAPPPEATLLRIRREATGEEFSIPLTD